MGFAAPRWKTLSGTISTTTFRRYPRDGGLEMTTQGIDDLVEKLLTVARRLAA